MSLKFESLFRSIDESDTQSFVSFLSDNAVFKFGNLAPVQNKPNISQFLDTFFQSIDHTEHFEINEYKIDNIWFTTGIVEYTRLDGSKLKVPFCNKFEMNGGDLIEKYEIFVDNSDLYKQG